jgi:putative sulfotransferase
MEPPVFIVGTGRCGSTMMLFVPSLAKLFPEARFVHLHRDGRDAAISMRRHPFFRLSVRFAQAFDVMGLDPYRPPFLFGSSRLYPLFETLMGPLMPVDRWLREAPALETLGAHWSRTIAGGVSLLSALPADRVLTLRYKDILERPCAPLARRMEFLGPEYADRTWLAAAGRLPRRPTSDWRRLPADQQDRLSAACRQGLTILGYM